MKIIRRVCKKAHAERKRLGIPVSQPLSKMEVYLPEEDYNELIGGDYQ